MARIKADSSIVVSNDCGTFRASLFIFHTTTNDLINQSFVQSIHRSMLVYTSHQSLAPNFSKFFMAKELPQPQADSDCGLSDTTKADLIISIT
mmetsp:Transcript_14565/g.30226  ORF Transcript_14565/g.30226 Transcript_14565/m.30226 type:complete len:93 (+) Transcript_14565:1129-1407(+)